MKHCKGGGVTTEMNIIEPPRLNSSELRCQSNIDINNISFMIIWINFAKETSQDQFLTLNFVLTRVIHHPFVVGNRFMVSMKVK